MPETLDAQQAFEPLLNVPSNNISADSEPKIDSAVLPLLSNRKPLVDHLMNLITRERLRYNIPPHLMEIKLHVNSETGQKLIHIKQTVVTDAKTALEYWDKVSAPVDQWISTLPENQADIVRDEIHLTIHWKPNVSGQ